MSIARGEREPRSSTVVIARIATRSLQAAAQQPSSGKVAGGTAIPGTAPPVRTRERFRA